MSTPATSLAGNSGSFAGSSASPAAASSPTAWSNACLTSGSAPLTVKFISTTAPRSSASGVRGARVKSAGSRELVGSAGSWPAMAWSTARQSAAERASGPTLSKVHAHTMAPWRLTRP